jgi:hypothetical protein
MFTVCALFYGDHPDLAQRLLGESLSRPEWPSDLWFRLGINNVSTATEEIVWGFHAMNQRCTVFKGVDPYWKYPLMRRMLHDSTIKTPSVIWFDDDSWIDDDAPRDLFQQIAEKLKTHHVLGAPYYKYLEGGQADWIKAQPWYNGKPVHNKVDFITGGFLALRTELLMKHDWPPANFEHNGGDVMLGELCYQHGYRIGSFRRGLHINAKPGGKCSSSPRRGFSQQPIGVDYVPPATASFFDVLDGKSPVR